MTFEEQFPSLAKEARAICDNTDEDHYHNLWCEETVQKYCLDKQRVLEVVESYNFCMMCDEVQDTLIEELKELGLEE